MPLCTTNGIEVFYDTFGDPEDPPLLLVMGLATQMTGWDEDFCLAFVDRGFFVIRFDNRDVGLSTKISHRGDLLTGIMAAAGGMPVDAPYLLSDMAGDTVGLLDHLGVERAHVVGASMGGMIAQTVAIEHPERVLSLTSMMSTTGEVEVGQPTPEVTMQLLTQRPADRGAAIEAAIQTLRVIGSTEHFDEDRARRLATEAYHRSFHPSGLYRQLLAILASGSRAEGLRNLDVPTLVIHGDADPLITPSGGHRTAELVPGAELVIIEGMGHELPPALWPQIVEAITANSRRATVAG